MTVRYTDKNALSILFQLYGSVWFNVLPYCIINCNIACILIYCYTKLHYDISFSPQGHAVLGILVSFLILNKLYLAVDRYMTIKSHCGNIFISIRELHQLLLLFTTTTHSQNKINNNNNNQQQITAIQKQFMITIREMIYDFLESIVEVVQDDTKACYLWRNEKYTSNSIGWFGYPKHNVVNTTTTTTGNNKTLDINSTTVADDNISATTADMFLDSEDFDPLYYALLLRREIYFYNDTVIVQQQQQQQQQVQQFQQQQSQQPATTTSSPVDSTMSINNNPTPIIKKLELLERIKLLDTISYSTMYYRELLGIVAVPLPFPMIQMGRTFVFLWIFTMPCALIGLHFDIVPTIVFIFFITYGYIGLELVSMKLLYPFGNDCNDLNIIGILTATELSIEKDFDAIMNTNNNSSGSGSGGAKSGADVSKGNGNISKNTTSNTTRRNNSTTPTRPSSTSRRRTGGNSSGIDSIRRVRTVGNSASPLKHRRQQQEQTQLSSEGKRTSGIVVVNEQQQQQQQASNVVISEATFINLHDATTNNYDVDTTIIDKYIPLNDTNYLSTGTGTTINRPLTTTTSSIGIASGNVDTGNKTNNNNYIDPYSNYSNDSHHDDSATSLML